MEYLVYQSFAPRYSMTAYPVIVADEHLIPCYVNPAATACSVLEMYPDVLKNTLSPQAMQKVMRCRKEGTQQHFRQQFGTLYRKNYSVTVKSEEKGYLSFHFCKQLTPSLSPRVPDHDQQQEVFNTSLHQLLTASELLRMESVKNMNTMGELCRKQVYRAIRMARQNQAMSEEVKCVVAHAPTLLRSILEPTVSFVKERFNAELKYDIPEGNASMKCCPALIREILFALMASGIKRVGGDIYIKYMETEKEITLTLQHTNPQAPEPNGKKQEYILPPAALNLSWAQEVCRRQQIDLGITAPTGGQLMYCLTIPAALVNGSFKDRISICLEEDISTLEIHFSEI